MRRKQTMPEIWLPLSRCFCTQEQPTKAQNMSPAENPTTNAKAWVPEGNLAEICWGAQTVGGEAPTFLKSFPGPGAGRTRKHKTKPHNEDGRV